MQVETSVKVPCIIVTNTEYWTWAITMFGREILRCKYVDGESTEKKAISAAKKGTR